MLSLIALPNPVSVSVWFSFQVFAWGASSLCLAGSYHTSERLGKMSTRWQMGKQPQNSWRMVHRASSGASKGLIRCWHWWCTSHIAYLSKTNQQTLSSFPTALPTIHCQGGRSLHHPLPTICNHCPPRYLSITTLLKWLSLPPFAWMTWNLPVDSINIAKLMVDTSHWLDCPTMPHQY